MNQDASTLVGQTIGGYKLIRFIGQGLTGAVYEVESAQEDTQDSQQRLALKIFFPTTMNQEERNTLYQRFQREAEILSKLDHPHILKVLKYGQDGQYAYLVLPLAVGGTLSGRMQSGPLSLVESVTILRQISAGLDYAHSRGVIHRDIKPSNILIDEQGRALIADFSIAKQLDSATTSSITRGNILGTFQYMAPEQASSDSVGPSADLYALGVVAYQMLTGTMPFKADTSLVLFFRQLITEPPPSPRLVRPDLPRPAEAVVLKALSKEPTERFVTATAFIDALGIGIQNRWPPDLDPLRQPPTASDVSQVPTPTVIAGPSIVNPEKWPTKSSNYAVYFIAIPLLLIAALLFMMMRNDGSSAIAIISPTITPTNTLLPTYTIPPMLPTYTLVPTYTIPPLQPTYTLVPTYTIPPPPPPPTYTTQPPPPPTNTSIPTSPQSLYPSCPTGFNCIDDSQFTYNGNWQQDGSNPGFYNGTQHWDGIYWGQAGDSASAAFNGSEVIYYAVVDTHHGLANVYIDGTFRQTVDLYRPYRQGFVNVWDSGPLPSGYHVITIYYINQKDSASTGTNVTVDVIAYRP